MELKEVVYNHLLSHRDGPRFYMGASMVGHSCDRYVWMNYRGFKGDSENPFQQGEDHPGRVFGIFQMGHDIEAVIVDALKDRGILEDTQTLIKEDVVRGHADGVLRIDGERVLLEIKSANKRRFDLFKKNGVEKTNIQYFVQMHIYMHFLLIQKAVFLVVSKDSFHIHEEEVPYNRKIAVDAVERARRLSTSKEPDAGFDKDAPECVFCDYRKYCHAGIKVDVGKKACLNCAHLTGGNHCGVHMVDIPHPERDCPQWEEYHLEHKNLF